MKCKSFLEKPYRHYHVAGEEGIEGDEKGYQIMYHNSSEETCAGVYTEDEIAYLLLDSAVVNSLTFIDGDADKWNDEEFRTRVCDKALKLIEENKNEKINCSVSE